MSDLITPHDLDCWGACGREADGERYSDEALAAILDGREGLTLAEVLHLDRVPSADRVWVACRALDPETRNLWITGVVERAVRDHARDCGVPAVEAWARSWLDGSDRSAGAAGAAAAWAWAVRARAAAAAAAEAARARQIADLLGLLEADDE